jgi:hypothetical protein
MRKLLSGWDFSNGFCGELRQLSNYDITVDNPELALLARQSCRRPSYNVAVESCLDVGLRAHVSAFDVLAAFGQNTLMSHELRKERFAGF